MRHLRMLGGGLLVAMMATALFAVPALAKKSPYNEHTWAQYKACPYEAEYSEVTDCFAGITAGGGEGGFFEYGTVKVKLDQSIRLQGGFRGGGSSIEVVPATHGYETLESLNFRSKRASRSSRR